MARKCVVSNCKNTGIHKFPLQAKRQKQWKDAVNKISGCNKDWAAIKEPRVCPNHFSDDDYLFELTQGSKRI